MPWRCAQTGNVVERRPYGNASASATGVEVEAAGPVAEAEPAGLLGDEERVDVRPVGFSTHATICSESAGVKSTLTSMQTPSGRSACASAVASAARRASASQRPTVRRADIVIGVCHTFGLASVAWHARRAPNTWSSTSRPIPDIERWNRPDVTATRRAAPQRGVPADLGAPDRRDRMSVARSRLPAQAARRRRRSDRRRRHAGRARARACSRTSRDSSAGRARCSSPTTAAASTCR